MGGERCDQRTGSGLRMGEREYEGAEITGAALGESEKDRKGNTEQVLYGPHGCGGKEYWI